MGVGLGRDSDDDVEVELEKSPLGYASDWRQSTRRTSGSEVNVCRVILARSAMRNVREVCVGDVSCRREREDQPE